MHLIYLRLQLCLNLKIHLSCWKYQFTCVKCSRLERICSIWGTKAATASAAASHSILKSLLRNFLDGIASPDTSEWLVYYFNNFHTIVWVGKQINLDLLYIPEIWHQETHQIVILLSKWTQPDISKSLRPILSGVGRVHFLLGRKLAQEQSGDL